MQNDELEANQVLQGYAGLFMEDRPISYSLAYYFYKMKATIDDMVAMEIESKGKDAEIKILDMGCNRGYDIFRMNKRFANWNVHFIGLDISPLDIEYANEVKTKHSLENCKFLVGKAEDTDLEAEGYDIAICSEVLEHIPKPDMVLKEIHRTLRNGGVGIITTPNAENKIRKLKKFAPSWLKKGWNKPSQERSDVEYSQKAESGFVNLPHISEKGIKEWIQISKDTGFKVENVRRGSLMWGHEFFDEHPGLTGMLLFFDSILDKITYDFSPNFVMKIRK